MKFARHFFFALGVLTAQGLAAQVPQQINYQAVARNAAGAVLSNQTEMNKNERSSNFFEL